jgi:hypothetical protein
VRPKITAEDEGKFAAIDIENGECAIDADELKACHKLRQRIPEAQIWMMRSVIGMSIASVVGTNGGDRHDCRQG